MLLPPGPSDEEDGEVEQAAEATSAPATTNVRSGKLAKETPPFHFMRR
jgi:hypothetical protein